MIKTLLEQIEEGIRLRKYNELRQKYLKKFLCNIGRIIEEENRIICYVDQKSLEEYRGVDPCYSLRLNGMTIAREEIAEKFNFNKPVYYIFDNILFNNAIKMTSDRAQVIFKNCSFDKNVGILWGDEITFENNKFKDCCNVYFYGKCFLTANNVKKISFINENFMNGCELKGYSNPLFGMRIDAGVVEIINSEINAEAPAAINIKAKKLRIKNSKLQSPEIYIDSQSIEFDGTMQASDGVMIENANYDFSGSVMAPIILYNGIDLANKINSTCNITADVVALAEVRKEFGEKLKIVSDYCQQINARKMQVAQNNLNNRSVLRTLKKK